MLEGLRRYLYTIRGLRLSQVVGRVLPEVRRRLARWGLPTTRLPSPPGELNGKLSGAERFLSHAPWNRRDYILRGRFTFLNQSCELGRPVDWSPGGVTLLWKYNLHYFDYLHLLDPEEKERLCLEWVHENPVARTVGWDPYPTSRRIVNWYKADLGSHVLLRSLYEQAAYLHRNVEEHILGNHLLANAKALLFASSRFEGSGESSRWRTRAEAILRRELPEQILPDGGHFERSPMYHAIVFHDVLDMIQLGCAARELGEILLEVARRMAEFLLAMTHPDGRISLFNDATLEITPTTERLLRYGRGVLGDELPRAIREGEAGVMPDGAFEDSGYYVVRGPEAYLVVDGGKVGPDYLPAHAHADIFSFELSVGARRVVVDRGCYEYAPGPIRNEDRHTSSHNTVTVDRTSQAECWKSFRVARRYPPKDVRFERTAEGATFKGSFDGYARLIGDDIVHRRHLRLDMENGTLDVEDVVHGCGRHLIESRVHLHPAVDVEEAQGDLFLTCEGMHCSVRSLAGVLPEVRPGFYSPEFGTRRATSVLVFRAEGYLPKRLAYRLAYSLDDSCRNRL